MEFKKYQHVERLGSDEVEGILKGICYVFPKIDGTNSQLWWDNDLKAGSRNRELSVANDNAGFCDWALKQEKFYNFFNKYKNLRLYGEWLVPHTLRIYKISAWNNFYVFDVIEDEKYLRYEDYKILLDEFGIDYIPPICKIENTNFERLISLLDKNTYLIEDGKGFGEGIVIKNYDYKNKYGRVVWAKMIRNEFKELQLKNEITIVKEKMSIEDKIVNKYVTESLIEKEFAKMKNESGWSSSQIPKLLSTVFYCLITEEMWHILKEFKNPTIDFKKLQELSYMKVKEYLSKIVVDR